jgi:hypothetical protein
MADANDPSLVGETRRRHAVADTTMVRSSRASKAKDAME